MERRTKQATAKGPSGRFTGDVWIDPIAQGQEPSRIRVNVVHFTPGARTAWHSHAMGQTLYVTEEQAYCNPAARRSRISIQATSSIRLRTSGTGTAQPPTTS